MAKGIVIGLFCFLLFLSHTFIFHEFNIKRRLFTMVSIFFCVMLIYVALFFMISENQIEKFSKFFIPLALLAFLNGAFLHFFFCYFYLHLIQVIDRSPSTRIMVEIENSPQKRLTLEEIKQLYSIDKKISQELEDMVILRRLNKESDFYINTDKGRTHLKIFKYIRDYLKLRRS